jgi:quinol monooxygenase YgiN
MTEPTYIAQNGDLTDTKSVHAWFRERSEEARQTHGCRFFRYSEHPDIPHLVLIEGWAEAPEAWVYGEPRWQLAAA